MPPKVGVLFESDFYEAEIFYYQHRFAEAEIELHFLTRLWGAERQTFTGHEYKVPIGCGESFESIDDEALRGYSALIVPSGMVADRLRYTEDVTKIPPATRFLARAFAQPSILKGIICHGLWLTAPMPELVRGRRLTCHNNLIGDARAYGAIYVDEDVVVDGDLVTARSGAHCHLLAKSIIGMIRNQRPLEQEQLLQPVS
ncbi:MAG: DJ-1/PfpI family protein [Thermoanaerobaculia bacterium]